MEIRNYIKQDKGDCLEIVKSNVPTYFCEEDFEEFKKWFKSQKCQNLYVLTNDKRIIGIGGFYFLKEQARLIYGLIHNHYHGKGYGHFLTGYRIKRIKEIDPNIPIGLETTERTYRFFEKFGFKTVDISKKYYFGKFDKYEMILRSKMKTPVYII